MNPPMTAPAQPVQGVEAGSLLDRFERAAMAYERLGKMTRDDEKTRQIRKDAIAELASARSALLALVASPAPAPEAPAGWQDISTAPKDFVTDIDMWANGERLTDCSWMRPTYGPREYAWCRHAYDDCNGPVYNEVRGATHWMPLPEPPDLASQADGTKGEA